MSLIQKIILTSFLFLLNNCISKFLPEANEDKELLVVEGLITDQPGINTVKLSRSLPPGVRNTANPVTGCSVQISDNFGNKYSLNETEAGTYITDSSIFQGIIGRSYILHIILINASGIHHYESFPMEMKPVPPIDSIYYEKVTINPGDKWNQAQEGCQVYLNTHDPTNQCKYYRWEYTETWKIVLPYSVPNKVCWVSANSDLINIKNTSVIYEDRIDRFPLSFISNATDRLSVKYSMLVNQYSLNEDEYLYWEKLQNITQQVGGLYDIVPAAIPSNVYSLDDPNEKVLGYFSVSASSSKRTFIKDHFYGLANPYTAEACGADTVYGGEPIPNLNISIWIIADHQMPPPPYKVTTYDRGCADCTVRGTNIEPDFWEDKK